MEQLLATQLPAQDSICVEAQEGLCPLWADPAPQALQPQGPHHSGLTFNIAQVEFTRLGTWDKSSDKVVTVLVPVAVKDVWVRGKTHKLGPPGLDEVGVRAAAEGAGILILEGPAHPLPQQEAQVSPSEPISAVPTRGPGLAEVLRPSLQRALSFCLQDCLPLVAFPIYYPLHPRHLSPILIFLFPSL